MKLKRLLCFAAAVLLSAALLCPSAAAAYKSASVISAALNEVGYHEGSHEYSKYGAWYGLPNAYWCDMFVSWCGMKGGIPSSLFPRNCSCTEHVRQFAKLGLYHESASRGGTYVPKQGDVIFYYNYKNYPSGSVKNHTGLVLYVENGYVFTIEGNALANRLDQPGLEAAGLRDDSQEPPDYVTVNCYPLDAARIHGYGTPAYADRTLLTLTGFVDLGRHREKDEIFHAVADAGVMPATSSHTFSPNHGMLRGDFLQLVTGLFGLSGYDASTVPFADVPPDSPYYDAVMTARSAQLVYGTPDNRVFPNRYVSAEEAQNIISRAQSYVGLKADEFVFTQGDYGYLYTPYTIRADIAQAFYTVCQEMPVSQKFDGEILLNDTAVDWAAILLDDVCYVPAGALLDALAAPAEPEEDPEPDEEEKTESDVDADDTDAEEAGSAEETDGSGVNAEEPEQSEVENTVPAVKLPVPLGNTERVVPGCTVTLQLDSVTAAATGLTYKGKQYISLTDAAALLPLNVEWTDSSHAVITLQNTEEAEEAAAEEAA
ncbi:MAG: S-layer homology domain-containing protein [Oscillospiraceae bacterium]|nr:S-layer homology domain-containing protein [Oscillospiraceae bacterium]